MDALQGLRGLAVNTNWKLLITLVDTHRYLSQDAALCALPQ